MNIRSPNPSENPADDRLAAQQARLEVLAEIGLGLARRLMREVEEAEPGRLDVGAVALAYSRIAKAVRQTLMLSARLDAEAAGARTAASARPFWEAPARPPLVLTRRDKAVSAVSLAIDVAAGENETKFERLDDALCDELDELEDDVFDERPIGAIVVEICQALGVEPDLSLWEDEDWAIEEARTGAVGSPYARAATAPAGAGPDAAATAILEHPPP